MPIRFIDTNNFATATAVYTNSTLTVADVDGWYSYCGVVRRQYGGFLLPPLSCEDPSIGCALTCNPAGAGFATITPTANTQGVFDSFVNVGSGIGAIRCTMTVTPDAGSTPQAWIFEIDGESYPNPALGNRGARSCENINVSYGITTPVTGRYTGRTNPCTAQSTIINNLKRYINNNGTWTYSTIDVSEYIDDITLNIAGLTGNGLVLFIPKKTASSTTLYVRGVFPCNPTVSGSFATVSCPYYLPGPSTKCGYSTVSSAAASAAPQTVNIFQGRVGASDIASGGAFNFYDWVFNDKLSTGLVADGWYAFRYTGTGASTNWVQVQNGIVIAKL